MAMSRRRRILWSVLALLVLAILIVRAYMAVWLTNYVNKVLSDLNGYHGSIKSISIGLLEGSYRINGLEITKQNGKFYAPFIDAGSIDLSLQWSGLIHGRIVSDIHIADANVNFAVDKTGTVKQTGTEIDWTKKVKELMPIDINEITIQRSKISYKDFSSTPQVNIYMADITGKITNIRNVTDKDKPLPSTFSLKGTSIGQGTFKLAGKANIIKQMPDVDMAAQLENVNLPALNSYSQAYGAIDFDSGKFSVYSEVVVKDSKLSGYVKPIASNISIVNLQKEHNPFKLAWESAVSVVLEIFTNHSKDQFATRIELSGDLSHPDTDTWSTIVGIFHNAFVKAFDKRIDSAKPVVAEPDV